jgi:single-stranded-DNA-specific exonuclease
MTDSLSSPPQHSTQRSATFPEQRWHIAEAEPDRLAQWSQTLQLDPLLVQVLLNRGMETLEQANVFMHPETAVLPLPTAEFTGLPKAVDLLAEAIAQHSPITICGDYDADGMTSTALLLRALKHLGAIANYAIPSRMQEGYGLNLRMVEEFHQAGIKLILTVDNGIAAHAPIAKAKELGLTVIVTDHHDLPAQLPVADVILNPKLIPSSSPYRGLAGVGVAYVLAVCLAQHMQFGELTCPSLELFTLGTIADLAPLTGVNRRWVRRGLKLLPHSKIAGVQALIQVAGLSNEKQLKPEAIGFRLGPRINAIGRISDPAIVIELLTTDDAGKALELAMICEQINQKRQCLCNEIEQEAIAWCQANSVDVLRDRVLLIVQPHWHHGVIGIVASRLVERYGVPVFIGTYEGEDRQIIRGSARGISEFDVFAALQTCEAVLEKYGGHRAAGGFSFHTDKLEDVQSLLRQSAHQQLAPQHLKPLIRIDAQADLEQLTLTLHEQIDHLHPCGIENPDPVFWTPQVRVIEQQTIGNAQTHLKLVVAQTELGQLGRSMKAIAWRWGEYYPVPRLVDIAYRLRVNEWNGEKNVELELVGLRPSDLTSSTEITKSKVNGSVNLRRNDNGSKVNLTTNTQMISCLDAALTTRELETARSTTTKVAFFYKGRKYICSLTSMAAIRELRIRNPEGLVLAVQARQSKGLLGKKREDAREVDVTQPHFSNLIRAAFTALEQLSLPNS